MADRAQRYSAVAIVLHWSIAFAILLNFPLGLWMHEQAEDGAASQGLFEAYQLHKSIGLTVLALSLVRLVWRLMHPPPPFAEGVAAWERLVAKATHWAFYALMIGVPLSGWIFVSAGWSLHADAPLPVPTRWFGLFEVPHLFGLERASAEVREETADVMLDAHALLAFVTAGLAVVHVGAALKHHLLDRDATLAHMLPGLRAPGETGPAPENPGRLAVLGIGLGLAGVALAAAAFAIVTHVTSPAAPASSLEIVETPPVDEAALAAPPSGAPAPASIAAWRVDQAASSIGFAYTYEDESGATGFNGRFARWRADIRFDPRNLEQSSAVVRIETASAATGVAMHDAALPGAEWFDSGANPVAEFRTTRIRARGDGYEARGELTIRGRTRTVDLPFTLRLEGDRAIMSGRTTIDRRDFDIGKDGDGDDLISREIALTIRVEATRAP